MGDKIEINGRSVRLGEKAQIKLQIAKLPTHTVIHLPIYVYRGEEKGPVLMLTAGVHGDEINGIETIRRMIADGSIHPDRGTVITMPVVNIYGFLSKSRELPDGRDLNRTFPGTKDGSLASRIAYALMNEVIPIVDCGVDFHTGGANANFPQIRCLIDGSRNLELARAFSPPYILNSKLRDGSFRKEASKKGKHILVYEGGESLRFDEFAITEGVTGVKRLMHNLGMSDRCPSPNKTILIARSSWIRARNSGLFRTFVRNGKRVKEGQLLATITDPFGEVEYEIRARRTGYILSVKNMPVVNKGDALINMGVEK